MTQFYDDPCLSISGRGRAEGTRLLSGQFRIFYALSQTDPCIYSVDLEFFPLAARPADFEAPAFARRPQSNADDMPAVGHKIGSAEQIEPLAGLPDGHVTARETQRFADG